MMAWDQGGGLLPTHVAHRPTVPPSTPVTVVARGGKRAKQYPEFNGQLLGVGMRCGE